MAERALGALLAQLGIWGIARTTLPRTKSLQLILAKVNSGMRKLGRAVRIAFAWTGSRRYIASAPRMSRANIAGKR